MKAIDLEKAEIDSCVLRITLDAENAPLLYETIAACGCFHKVFVERWVEEGAKETFGPPEKDKKFSVERAQKDAIDWEVAGVVDEPREQPRRPVVFIKAGDHKVIGMGSAARLRVPPTAESHPYEITSYEDLYTVKIDGSSEQSAFFDMDNGGKVRGAERKNEKFLMSFIGVDAAGQPRADDQIKMHFDESTWGDATIYSKYLRLPPGSL
jgi:ribosomal protein S18 acetylase RimI-like enzyme